MDEFEDDSFTLKIYRAPSGQWAGRLVGANGIEFGGISGCESPEAVEEAAAESGIIPDRVEVIRSEEG
jgi:hypothetical protein